MTEVTVNPNEDFDKALRRFRQKCARQGIKREIRKREHYEKPSVTRKRKQQAAVRKERRRSRGYY
ncbi:MAG: 30S ribosomal protein S21 [bacterium]|nr:30S ribosomal protein S21 [bacterium]